MTRAILAAAVAAALATPTTARAAGTYEQQLCNTGYPLPGAGALYTTGVAGGISIGCVPGAAYPGAGVYGNTPSLAESHWHAVRADAPPGARYTSLLSNLRIPFQDLSRNTWIVDGAGYAWQDHNGFGGGRAFNPAGNTFGVALRTSPWFAIGQSCNGSGGACFAGDWYFDSAVATLYDATAPAVTPADSGLFARARTAFRGTVGVSADLVDDGKGPQAVRIEVDGAVAGGDAWPDSTCNFRLANPCASRLGWTRAIDTAAYADGVHSVRVRADDGLGNVGAAARAVTFDNTAPDVSAGGTLDGRTASAEATEVPVSAGDATSGVAGVEALVDGGAWQPVAAAVRVSGSGTHRVRLRATDRVGNVSAERQVSFTLQPVPANQRLVARGDRLECEVGAPWSQGTAFSYQWLRDGAVVDGATGQAYSPGAADAGRRLGCRVLAANEAGLTRVDVSAVTVAEPEPASAPAPRAESRSSEPPPATLTAAFEGGRAATIRWGERRRVAGTLLHADGRPVAGAALRVSSRVLAPGAPRTELGVVATDPAGRFAFAIPTGPSRVFTVRHERLAFTVTVRVIPRVTLAVDRRGRVSGRVYGAPARARRRVALQVRRRGAWRTVASARLGAGGGFRGRVGAGRPVRALVRAAPGWPFETGRSRAVY